MDIAHTTAAERIARVLAAHRLSANGTGLQDSAADTVDDSWREHLGEALAVLATLREPDRAMAEAGDPAIWERMIRTAIEQAEQL